jgi:uncharacterized protein (DUF4415 family)
MSKSKLTQMKLGDGKTTIPSSRLAKLLALQDKDIDTSEIPEITAEWIKQVKIISPTTKTLKSVRIDSNVLSFIQKKQGKGYQTLINSILTEWAKHNGMKR